MKGRTLTELENCVLGVVWLRGPCTAYVVRQEFASSETPHWSSSAGSIYPVLERLQNLGAVRSQSGSWGQGSRKQYQITPSGLETLRLWIGPPIAEGAAAPTFDPIRTRMFFLEALPPSKRIRYVDEAIKATRAVLDELRSNLSRRPADDMDALASLGTVFQLEGRIAWLRRIRRAISRRK